MDLGKGSSVNASFEIGRSKSKERENTSDPLIANEGSNFMHGEDGTTIVDRNARRLVNYQVREGKNGAHGREPTGRAKLLLLNQDLVDPNQADRARAAVARKLLKSRQNYKSNMSRLSWQSGPGAAPLSLPQTTGLPSQVGK